MVFMIKLRGTTDLVQVSLLLIWKALPLVDRRSLEPQHRRDWAALRKVWVGPALVEEGNSKVPPAFDNRKQLEAR